VSDRRPHPAGRRERASVADLLRAGTDEHYLDAPLYDFEYGDRTHDIDYYLALADELRADEVVEIGAGTGRIAIPLAAAGHRVVAVDRMPEMLAALTAKLARGPAEVAARIAVRRGDTHALPVDADSVPLVIAPFNVWMHLYTWDALLAALREARRVLRPGGQLAFDVQLPDVHWLTWDPDERHAVTRFRHPVTDEPLIYSTNHTYDPATQVCHVRIFYDRPPPKGRRISGGTPVRVVHLAHRQYFPEELRALVHAAGLELLRHGDWDGGPLRAGTDSQVVVARRP